MSVIRNQTFRRKLKVCRASSSAHKACEDPPGTWAWRREFCCGPATHVDPAHTGPLWTRRAHGSGAHKAVAEPPRHVGPEQTAPSWTRQARGSGAHKASWMRQARGSGTHRGLCGHAKHLGTACKGLQRLAKHVATALQKGPLNLPGLWFRQLVGGRKSTGRPPWHQEAKIGNTETLEFAGPLAQWRVGS